MWLGSDMAVKYWPFKASDLVYFFIKFLDNAYHFLTFLRRKNLLNSGRKAHFKHILMSPTIL